MRDPRRSGAGKTISRRLREIRAGAVFTGLLMFAVGIALAVFVTPGVLERGAVYFNGESTTGTVTQVRVVSKGSGPATVTRDVREVFVSYSVDGRTFGIWMADDALAVNETLTVHYAVADPTTGHPDSPGGRLLGSLLPLVVPPFLLVFGIRLLLDGVRGP